MSNSGKRLALAAALATVCAFPIAARQAAAPAGLAPEAAAIKRLAWRSIGPANPGGRVADIVGIPGNPAIFYVVPANAGIFKTINRCPSKLREQIQSLSGEINRFIGAPTEGQKLRVREVTDETGQAIARLNAIMAGPIAEINTALASAPHVVAQPVK